MLSTQLPVQHSRPLINCSDIGTDVYYYNHLFMMFYLHNVTYRHHPHDAGNHFNVEHHDEEVVGTVTRHLPIRHLPRDIYPEPFDQNDICPENICPEDIYSDGHFPIRRLPRRRLPRKIFAKTDICPEDICPEGRLPRKTLA
jgi:hypothetical protein